jgi:hypothetical protein
MENDKRKRVLFLIGSIIVALMFVSSYAAFGNNGSVQTTTTTTTIGYTIPVFGTANAVVIGYGSKFTIYLSKNASSNLINSTLSNLQLNGSISNYIGLQKVFTIYAGNMSSYSLLGLLNKAMPQNSIIANVSENVTLPTSILMTYPSTGRQVEAYFYHRNAIVYRGSFSAIGSNTPVHISALIFVNNATVENYTLT